MIRCPSISRTATCPPRTSRVPAARLAYRWKLTRRPAACACRLIVGSSATERAPTRPILSVGVVPLSRAAATALPMLRIRSSTTEIRVVRERERSTSSRLATSHTARAGRHDATTSRNSSASVGCSCPEVGDRAGLARRIENPLRVGRRTELQDRLLARFAPRAPYREGSRTHSGDGVGARRRGAAAERRRAAPRPRPHVTSSP